MLYLDVSVSVPVPVFVKKVVRFFSKRNIKIDNFEESDFMKHLYSLSKQQGRFNNRKSFYVTTNFIINALSSFLKIKSSNAKEFLHDLTYKKSFRTNALQATSEALSNKLNSKGLIAILGRRHKPKYKITKPDGSPLTPTKVSKIQDQTQDLDVSFSPFKSLSGEESVRKRAISSKDEIFEQDMVSSESSLWRERTPTKQNFLYSPDRIKFKKVSDENQQELCQNLTSVFEVLAKKDTVESFEFSVNRKDIIDRLHAQRPVSQKQVMGNITAIEIMRALGAIIEKNESGRKFHWAHRHGWSLNGEQSKENLDPTTAGSNYDTLFKVEAPLKKLLLNHEVDEVLVKGSIEFDKTSGLPYKIKYHLSWGTEKYIEIVIDPMSHRVPTVSEHEMALSFLETEGFATCFE